MDLKKKIAKVIAILMMVITATTALPPMEAEAAVSREQQLEYVGENLPITLELEAEYGVPHQLALAMGGLESDYGTSEFAETYNNLTGYACYRDDADGPVVCHEDGQFDSTEECWEAYFDLLANKYGKADWYINAPKQLVRDIEGTYCPGTPGYADLVCAMIDTVDSLESEVVEIQEAEEAAAAERAEQEKQEEMENLGDEQIIIRDEENAVEPNNLIAGATAVMFDTSYRGITVKEAADEVLAGNFGSYAERREILGDSYEKVQTYIEYVTLPA